jgi:hypothetical protein
MIRNEEADGSRPSTVRRQGAGLLLCDALAARLLPRAGACPRRNTVHATRGTQPAGPLAGEVAARAHRADRSNGTTDFELSALDAPLSSPTTWLAPAEAERPLRFELKSVPAERDFTL